MAITREERLFLDNFLSALEYIGAKEIPFCNERYKEGIKSIKTKLRKEYPKEYEKLKILFIPMTLDGEYVNINDAIMSMLGPCVETNASAFDKLILLINPPWKKPNKMYLDLAKTFYERTKTDSLII